MLILARCNQGEEVYLQRLEASAIIRFVSLYQNEKNTMCFE